MLGSIECDSGKVAFLLLHGCNGLCIVSLSARYLLGCILLAHLFHALLHYVLDYRHLFCLAHPQGSRDRLLFDGWVPLRLNEMDTIRDRQCESIVFQLCNCINMWAMWELYLTQQRRSESISAGPRQTGPP